MRREPTARGLIGGNDINLLNALTRDRSPGTWPLLPRQWVSLARRAPLACRRSARGIAGSPGTKQFTPRSVRLSGRDPLATASSTPASTSV
jgi:hypothetical protein